MASVTNAIYNGLVEPKIKDEYYVAFAFKDKQKDKSAYADHLLSENHIFSHNLDLLHTLNKIF